MEMVLNYDEKELLNQFFYENKNHLKAKEFSMVLKNGNIENPSLENLLKNLNAEQFKRIKNELPLEENIKYTF